MPATAQEVETSMTERLEDHEKRVREEKSKRSSCIAAMRNSLAALNEVLAEDLEDSEENTALAAEAKLGGK